jgi:hypothetical protein
LRLSQTVDATGLRLACYSLDLLRNLRIVTVSALARRCFATTVPGGGISLDGKRWVTCAKIFTSSRHFTKENDHVRPIVIA